MYADVTICIRTDHKLYVGQVILLVLTIWIGPLKEIRF